MNVNDSLMLNAANRLMADVATPELIERWERSGPDVRVLASILESGLNLAWIPESMGGVGGSMQLGFDLIRSAAVLALPAPLAESLVANLLLAQSGLTVSQRWTALGYDGGELAQLKHGVVNGTIELGSGVLDAALIVVPVREGGAIRLATFAPSTIEMKSRTNLAGESRTAIYLRSSVPSQLSSPLENVSEEGIRQFCALVRAVQIAGALQKMVEMTVQYVSERKQFGRTLGAFQAIQNRVASMTGEMALVGAAVQDAIRAVREAEHPLLGDRSSDIAITTAKVVAGQAAFKVTQDAHQAHGAMGFSYEYPLQFYSRRVWLWREEFGSDFYWSKRMGELIQAEVQGLDSEAALGKAWELATL